MAGRGGRGWELGCCTLLIAAGCGSRSGLDDLRSDVPEREPLAARDPQPQASFFPDLPEPAPPAPGRSGCVDITRSYTSVPATVMLLIDQSGSMNAPFGNSSRWDVLRQAIVDPEVGLLAWLDPASRIGLMLYTSIDGFWGGGSCPMMTRVDAQFDNVERVRGAYLASEPLAPGDTPTAESIDEAVLQLSRVEGAAPKYILLLTDGVPDTCAQPDPQNGLSDAIAAAQRAFARGVRVYTVGVSEDIGGAGLQWMANAGAGKEPRALVWGRDPDAEPPLSASSDPRELADQLKGIIGDVRTCTVELGTDVGSRERLEGRIALDGEALEYGDQDGWSFVDTDTLLVHGSACERIRGDGERLEVRFPCLPEPALR